MGCRSCLGLTFLCCLYHFAAGGAVAQERPRGRFEGRVEVIEVLLDVLATDRSGQVVTGLGKDDFIVEENGRPVELTSVSFYTTQYSPEGDLVPLPGQVPASRYFLFFFHDQTRLGAPDNRLVRQQLRATRESQRFIREQMQPSDWVAVVSYDVKLKVHRDFTQDRAAILQGIEDAGRGRDPEKGLGRQGRAVPPLGSPSLLRHLPQGRELRKKTARIYDGLRLVAEAVGHIVGRKNLVLFSIGFGDLGAGRPIPEPDPRYYPDLKHALNDHNVAIYPIDLTPQEFEHVQADFLSLLASDTGGYYYENFLSFDVPLGLISEENVGYYLLSYQSRHPAAEAGYQRVKVKTRQRSVKVRARQGYRYGSHGG